MRSVHGEDLHPKDRAGVLPVLGLSVHAKEQNTMTIREMKASPIRITPLACQL